MATPEGVEIGIFIYGSLECGVGKACLAKVYCESGKTKADAGSQ